MPDRAEQREQDENFYFEVSVAGPAGELSERLPSELLPGIDEQGLLSGIRSIFVSASKEDVLSDWDIRVGQMKNLIERAASAVPGDFGLDSVKFALSFNAEAGFWMFAKAGAGASVEVMFKRR